MIPSQIDRLKALASRLRDYDKGSDAEIDRCADELDELAAESVSAPSARESLALAHEYEHRMAAPSVPATEPQAIAEWLERADAANLAGRHDVVLARLVAEAVELLRPRTPASTSEPPVDVRIAIADWLKTQRHRWSAEHDAVMGEVQRYIRSFPLPSVSTWTNHEAFAGIRRQATALGFYMDGRGLDALNAVLLALDETFAGADALLAALYDRYDSDDPDKTVYAMDVRHDVAKLRRALAQTPAPASPPAQKEK